MEVDHSLRWSRRATPTSANRQSNERYRYANLKRRIEWSSLSGQRYPNTTHHHHHHPPTVPRVVISVPAEVRPQVAITERSSQRFDLRSHAATCWEVPAAARCRRVVGTGVERQLVGRYLAFVYEGVEGARDHPQPRGRRLRAQPFDCAHEAPIGRMACLVKACRNPRYRPVLPSIFTSPKGWLLRNYLVTN